SIAHLQLLDDAVDVIANGVVADSQSMADLLISEALGKYLEDLEFARSKIRTRHALREPGGDRMRNIAIAGAHRANGVRHFPLRGVLEQVAFCPRLNRAID